YGRPVPPHYYQCRAHRPHFSVHRFAASLWPAGSPTLLSVSGPPSAFFGTPLRGLLMAGRFPHTTYSVASSAVHRLFLRQIPRIEIREPVRSFPCGGRAACSSSKAAKTPSDPRSSLRNSDGPDLWR